MFKNGCQGPTLKILTQRVWSRAPGVCVCRAPPSPTSDSGARKLRGAPVHRTQIGSLCWDLVLPPVTAFHPNRSCSNVPLVGITLKTERAAPHAGNKKRRASNTAESFGLLCFVISTRKRCKFRHRCFRPGQRPHLPRAGEGRRGWEETRGRGEGEAGTGRSCGLRPPLHLSTFLPFLFL